MLIAAGITDNPYTPDGDAIENDRLLDLHRGRVGWCDDDGEGAAGDPCRAAVFAANSGVSIDDVGPVESVKTRARWGSHLHPLRRNARPAACGRITSSQMDKKGLSERRILDGSDKTFEMAVSAASRGR